MKEVYSENVDGGAGAGGDTSTLSKRDKFYEEIAKKAEKIREENSKIAEIERNKETLRTHALKQMREHNESYKQALDIASKLKGEQKEIFESKLKDIKKTSELQNIANEINKAYKLQESFMARQVDLIGKIAKGIKQHFKAFANAPFKTILKTMNGISSATATFAKNIGKAVISAKAFVATGIGALITMIGKVFNFASDVLNQYKGATSHNIAAAKMGVDGNQLLAIQQVMKHNGLENEDLIGSMTKAFDSVRDWNKASNFAALGLSQEKIAKMDGVEANRYMMDSMIDQVKKMGGFDNKDAKALLKDHIESIGFSWDTLMAMDKFGLDKSIWEGNGKDNVTYASSSAKIKESGRDMNKFSEEERAQGVKELNRDFNKTAEQARQAAAKAGRYIMEMFDKLLKAIEPLGEYINKFSTTISDFINGIKEAFGEAGIMGLVSRLKLAFINLGTEIKYVFLGIFDAIRGIEINLGVTKIGGMSDEEKIRLKQKRENDKARDLAQNRVDYDMEMSQNTEDYKRKQAEKAKQDEAYRQLEAKIRGEQNVKVAGTMVLTDISGNTIGKGNVFSK